MRILIRFILTGLLLFAMITSHFYCQTDPKKRPNILFAISDDQSWEHAGVYGCKMTETPHIDRIAREGVLFTNAFCSAPQCSPCRASILTGRNIWQLEEAGTHGSNFPKKYQVYTDVLESSGYFVGYTGKPWRPGNWKITGWKRNPAGTEFNEYKLADAPNLKINNTDYAANFKAFLQQKPKDQPFCFWFGCHEPHRSYRKGSGLEQGKDLNDVIVPAFLPDNEVIRSDLLDYAVEIEWFDQHLGRMIKILEDMDELDNTLIVVTSDNGMSFPRAKANNYEYGIHVPLTIRWPEKIAGGRVVEDLIAFVDFAPTFLEVAGLKPLDQMVGKSFLNILISDKEDLIDSSRNRVFNGRERHTHARPDNLAYPCRAIRTLDYLYIRNFKPDRWPAGDPTGSGDPEGYHDIDACPTKTYMINNQESVEVKNLFHLAVGKRPSEELYDIRADKACLNNLAGKSEFQEIKKKLRLDLDNILIEQGDPRMHGKGDVFESYPRYSRMRDFPGFKTRGEYNPKYQYKE